MFMGSVANDSPISYCACLRNVVEGMSPDIFWCRAHVDTTGRRGSAEVAV